MFQIIDEQSRMPAPLKLDIVTAPAIEPVSYSELVDHLRLPTTIDRDLVMALESVGRDYVEKRTRQTLITTTFDYWLDEFPCQIILPARPFQAVTFIKWIDGTGAVQTLNPSAYQVDPKGTRPVIVPPLGAFFPIVKVQCPNAVQIRFTAGFGDTADDVPEMYKLMIKQFVYLNYDARAGYADKQAYKVPHTFDDLLNLGKIWEV